MEETTFPKDESPESIYFPMLSAIRIPMKHDAETGFQSFFFTLEGYTDKLYGPYDTYQEAYAAAVDKADELSER